jgi:hypothetical protein
MSIQPNSPLPVFRPGENVEFFVGTGKRKKPDIVESRPVRWPKTRREQYRQFDAWHAIAMQLIDHAGLSFRTIATFSKFVNWKTGTLWPTDKTFAAHAGNCAEKTVWRDIQNYKAIGVIDTKSVFRHRKKERIISLAYPVRFPMSILLPDGIDQMDTGGPFTRGAD